jgi:HEAT repeat protein
MNIRTLIVFCAAWGGAMLLVAPLAAAEPPLPELIAASKSLDLSVRLKAIDQIGERGDKAAEAVGPLVELLKDTSAQVRAHVAWSLGRIGRPAAAAVPALVALVKDPDEAVRRQAVGAVVAIRPGPKVTLPLAVNLLEQSDPAVRIRALNAIADTGADAVPGLIEALKNEKAVYWACLVLREIGPAAKDAVPALVATLHHPRAEVRREAILALAAMDEAAASAVPSIAGALGDPHTRVAATYALGRIGQVPAETEKTLRTNAQGGDKLLATSSLWALARIHPQDKELLRAAVERLVTGLKDPSPFVRNASAHGLASLPPAPEIAVPIFEKALADADEATVRQALGAVARLGAPVVPRLIGALKHPKARAGVAYALGEIGPAAAPATDALASLLGDSREEVVHEALIALAKIGPGAKGAVAALEKVLMQPDDANRPAAAYALGKIGPAAAAAEPALSGLLAGSDHELALVSAWALVHIHPGSAEVAQKCVPVLVAGLSAGLPHSRETAAKALGHLGPLAKDARPALETAAQDAEPGVRAAAGQALAAIGSAAEQPAPAADKTIHAGSTVVTREAVPMMAESQVVAQLPKGIQLRVLELRDPWVGVQLDIEGKPVTGWVLRTQVELP